jgi:hypothetical protein
MAKFPYIDFKKVYPLAEIEDIVRMLNLPVRGSANLRCSCPVHGGDERTLSITPAFRCKNGTLGGFKCWATGDGGDRIALVAHVMESSDQEAAHVINDHFGDGTVDTVPDRATVFHRVTVPDRDNVPAIRRQEREEPRRPIAPPPAPAPPTFDPEKFATRLVWHEEVAKLGLTEAQAAALNIGWHPQQKHVYLAVKYPSGQIAGFVGVRDGKIKLPPQWLPASANVVQLRRA